VDACRVNQKLQSQSFKDSNVRAGVYYTLKLEPLRPQQFPILLSRPLATGEKGHHYDVQRLRPIRPLIIGNLRLNQQ